MSSSPVECEVPRCGCEQMIALNQLDAEVALGESMSQYVTLLIGGQRKVCVPLAMFEGYELQNL